MANDSTSLQWNELSNIFHYAYSLSVDQKNTKIVLLLHCAGMMRRVVFLLVTQRVWSVLYMSPQLTR